jgi:P-loop Domain of unknown function (DUF2791)
MDPHEWLAIVQREYLRDFVAAGGAAVKFVVAGTEQCRSDVVDGLRQAATGAGYQFAHVDAAATRVHLIDKLFHEVARQVEWDTLARAFVAGLVREHGLRVPPDGALSLAAVAALNDHPEPLLRADLRRAIENRLFRDYAMSQEFRLAMIRLCFAQLDPSDDPALREAIVEWLRGELRLVSGVKRALIFQKIARHNARQALCSLAHWLTLAGRSGLVLCLDVSRYARGVPVAEREHGLYYGTSAAMDAYEVLRQLVDGTDDLQSCFIGVLADADFLQDDRRGLRGYQALYMRVWDEVRDRRRQNPLASLIRLVPAA